jgi:hypothetical protein
MIQQGRKSGFARLLATFSETFGLSRAGAFISVVLLSGIIVFAIFWFFHSAPPSTITITAGTPGSTYETNAIRYGKILARNGVTLKILPSNGSLQNFERLTDPSFHVDIGFVQGGATNVNTTNRTSRRKISSLGSVAYQPLMVFYRGSNSVTLLSELKGKRLVIGPIGSGTRSLVLSLLELNGITPGGPTTLLDSEAGEASKALLDGTVDAVFLMGDSASTLVMKQLLLTPGIQMFDFVQADGYTRRITYLNKLQIPRGSIDFGKNIPSHDVSILGPTVELLARSDFHPALSDMLLEAAQEVHGTPGLLRRKGEFPAPLEHEFPISAEATRYYKSGKSFLYRSLPFWLASLVNRVLVAFVPVVVLMIPAMKFIPFLFSLRVKLHFYRWYRALLALERELLGELKIERREQLVERLDHIQNEVNRMKVPASFADQFYALRGHIRFVRGRLVEHVESNAN